MLWTIGALGAGVSVYRPGPNRMGMVILVLAVGAACLTVMWFLAPGHAGERRGPTSVTDLRGRIRDAGGEQSQQDQARDRINNAFDAVATALGRGAGGELTPSVDQLAILRQACQARMGRGLPEVEIEVLGRTVTRSITPGSDPYAIWYDICTAIMDYVTEGAGSDDLFLAGSSTTSPSGQGDRAPDGGERPARHTSG